MTHSLLTLSYCRCDPSGSAHFLYSHCTCEIPDNVDFLFLPHTHCPLTVDVALLILYTFSSNCTNFSSHCTTSLGTAHFLSAYCRCGIPHTADFLLTPHALSFYCRCYLFLSLFFCYRRSLLLLYTFLPHAAKSSSRTADSTLLVLNTFSIGATGVTFLIMKTFSSHHTPCRPAADVTLLILYTLSTHCTAFSLYCRCDPPGIAHFLYSYCRCDIPDTADFLLTPYTLFFYYRCSPSDTVTLSSHCTAF